MPERLSDGGRINIVFLCPLFFIANSVNALLPTVASWANGDLVTVVAPPSLCGKVQHGVVQFDAKRTAVNARKLSDPFFMPPLLCIWLRVVFGFDAAMLDFPTH
jgi:hypothetical protein